jgi:hypothetical protein
MGGKEMAKKRAPRVPKEKELAKERAQVGKARSESEIRYSVTDGMFFHHSICAPSNQSDYSSSNNSSFSCIALKRMKLHRYQCLSSHRTRQHLKKPQTSVVHP